MLSANSGRLLDSAFPLAGRGSAVARLSLSSGIPVGPLRQYRSVEDGRSGALFAGGNHRQKQVRLPEIDVMFDGLHTGEHIHAVLRKKYRRRAQFPFPEFSCGHSIDLIFMM